MIRKLGKIKKEKLNILTTVANQLAAVACGIVVPHVLLTAFGSEAYGISVSITQFLSYISLLEGGIGGVARGKLYAPLAQKDEEGVNAVYHAVRHFFRWVAAAFLLYSLLLGVFYYDIAHVTLFSRGYVAALVVVIGLSTLAQYMGGLANLTLLVADQKQYVNNFVLIFTTIANTLLVVVLVWLHADLLFVKLASSLIFVVRPLLYAWYVRGHYHIQRTGHRRAVLEQKWTGLGQHIAYFLHKNTDIMLLTILANARYVAVYAVYNMVVSSIRALTEAFSGGMEAVFGAHIAKKEEAKLRAAYFRYKRLLVAAVIVLFGCAGILILTFVRLYTEDVTDANYIQPLFSVLLLLAEAINCLVLPCAGMAVAANALWETRWGAYGEAAINLGLSFLLIPWNPLLGVAAGTLAATLFRAIFYMHYVAGQVRGLSFLRMFLQFFCTLALLVAVIFFGRMVMESLAIYSYVAWAFCGGVCFVALAAAMGLWYFLGQRGADEK